MRFIEVLAAGIPFALLQVALRSRSDADLVQRLKAREPKAMYDLYSQYGRIAYSVIFRIVRGAKVAEDLLQETLLHRPRRTVLHKTDRWAVWYPLRRSGRFANLPPEEQRVILAEHGAIGMSFGAADLAHDIRLACHGLDTHDNDFVVGLIGKELFPLSAIVQTMRKTQQTSLYLERLGPFFVGRTVWQSA